MKELSLEKMETINGGSHCDWAYAGLAISTIGLFAAPFGGFVVSAYGADVC